MIITAILVLAAIGFCCGILLALGARIFYVEEDPRIETVRWALPGANCGMCGFPGCLGGRQGDRGRRGGCGCVPGRWNGCGSGRECGHGPGGWLTGRGKPPLSAVTAGGAYNTGLPTGERLTAGPPRCYTAGRWHATWVASGSDHAGRRLALPCAPATGRRVAVIGGGPAGLSCAYFLKRIGDPGRGRRPPRAIHHFLITGAVAVPAAPHQRINPVSILKQVIVTETIPKVRVPELSADLRRRSFVEEVVGSISEKEALQEAHRCLCCGLTCYDR